MLRRRIFPLLLACALLLTLQGSLQHAFTHASDSLASTQHLPEDGKHPASDKLCTLCLAFAALDTSAPSQHYFHLAETASPDCFCLAAIGWPQAQTAHYHPRAPPVSLA